MCRRRKFDQSDLIVADFINFNFNNLSKTNFEYTIRVFEVENGWKIIKEKSNFFKGLDINYEFQKVVEKYKGTGLKAELLKVRNHEINIIDEKVC